MKILIAFVAILLFSYTVNAQSQKAQDSVGKILRQKLNQLPPANDYSNPKANIPQPKTVTITQATVPKKINLDSTIVIIDNKIYSLASPEYIELNINDLAEPVTIIEDKSSKTAIKKVLIYKTKSNR
ncbi:MAG: hypothetical protein WDM90_17110 [Ferruginibacter sp.]